jgi:hypothetical protein
MPLFINHFIGKNNVADAQFFRQGTGKTSKQDHTWLIRKALEGRPGQQPIKRSMNIRCPDSGFERKHRQPGRSCEMSPTRRPGKSLLGPEFAGKRPTLPPQSEQDTRIIHTY